MSNIPASTTIRAAPEASFANLAPMWVANQADCDRALAELKHSDVIALDTEFVRRKTYFAELGLIQIASRTGVYLFDPTASYDDAGLGLLLKNPQQRKVLHSVGEDLEVLRDRFGAPPGPIFDTQIAASLAGLGAMQSLAKLVQSLLGEVLDKSETTSDWLKRPLSAAQIEYAATDVRVLLPMFDLLNLKLAELGRTEWVAEDCARVFDKANVNATDAQPHHKIKSTHYLAEESQRKLWRVLHWREAKARARNLPKSWVLDTQAAFEIAERLWRDENHFQRELDTKAPKSSKRGPELWSLLNQPSDDAGFEPAPRPLSAVLNERYKTLRSEVEARAAKLELAPELLATRRMLESRVLGKPDTDEWLGWRGLVLQGM
jgi:ribonuclease D